MDVVQLECGDDETWRHKELEDTPINIQMDVVQLESGDDETWRHKELEDTPINIQMDVVFSLSVVMMKHGATRS